jgi:hypothetical protein
MKRESMPEIYRIRVHGKLDPRWSEWLASMSIVSDRTTDGRPAVVLTGQLPDQAALRGVLNRLWDLNLDVVSVTRIANQGEDQ